MFSQPTEPLAGDTEIVVQTWGFNSNDSVKFTLKTVGEAYYYGERDCEYVIETMDPAEHTITGQHTGFIYYYTIDHEQQLTSDYEFIYGLLEIKAEWLNHPGLSSCFYYDARDV